MTLVLAASLWGCGAPDASTARHGDHGHHAEHVDDGHGANGHVHHRFDDPEAWAKSFDDPERDAWQQPDKVLATLDLAPGMTVADIGAGTGYFNPHLARAVGPEGVVLALDVEPAMVAYMTERAVRDGTPQVTARTVAPDDPGLAAASVDRILVLDTWHHLPDRTAYARHLAKALRPGGKLVVVDFTKEAPHGPPPAMRLTPDEVTAEVAPAGLRPNGQVRLPHQYVLVYTSKD